MNNFTLKKLLLIIVLAVMPFVGFAQNTNHWFIDIDGGGAILKGDNEAFQLSKMKFDARIGGGYAFAKHFTAYAKIGVGSLSGEKKFLYKVNESSFLTADLNVSADLISLIGGYREDRVFGLKPHVGIGYLYSNATAAPASTIAEQQNNKENVLEIPMGVEFEFNVSRKCSVYADFTLVCTNSDYLDGMKSGSHNDWYALGNVGFRYKFKKAKKEEPAKIAEQPKEEPVAEQPKEEPAVEQPKEEPVREEPVVEQPKEKPVPVVAEPVKPREVEYTGKQIGLTYNVGSYGIDSQKSQESFATFKKGLNDLKVEKITIKGYASPEGQAEANKTLSYKRASSAKEYLVSKFGEEAKDIEFIVSGEGADWEGFMAALGNSNIAGKDGLIKELNNSNNKIETLRKISTSNPEIKSLYPALRRSDVVVTFAE